MSRYIVIPILSPRNIPYYVVTDTSTGKGAPERSRTTDEHEGNDK